MTLKTFTGYLVLNYKTGEISIKKRKPNTLPHEIPVEIMIKVELPEQQIFLLKGDIEISPTKIREMTIDAMTEDDNKEE